MLLTKALLFLALPLALVGAISHQETSETIPPKSEIVFRIKRLLQILRDRRKYEAENAQEGHEVLNSRSMMERRKRLEEVLGENPGLSALIKKSLTNRKDEEFKMLENDPRRRCRPGIFFCKTSRDSASGEEAATLKKIFKVDDEVTKKRRCRPGLFWCQTRDASADSASQTQRKSLDLLETKAKADNAEQGAKQETLDKLLNILSREQQDPQRRRCRPGLFHCAQGDEASNVQIVRMPSEISKKNKIINAVKEDAQRRRCRPGLFHCESRDEGKNDAKGGENLADDLVKETLDNKNIKANDSPRDEKTSFNVDQLSKLLEGSKR